MAVSLSEQMKYEIEAFDDPIVFAEKILGIDWLFPWQENLLREYYEGNYKELVANCGMRSGKSLLASVIVCYELFKLLSVGDVTKYYGLPKGQDLFIVCVSKSEQQSKDTIFGHVEARIENCEWFMSRKPIRHQSPNEYIFQCKNSRVILRGDHSNSSSLAGRTAKCIVLDEVARFKDTDGPSSGSIVYETLKRAGATFGDEAKMILISSPLYKDDFFMRTFREAENDPTSLTFHIATWEANPKISFESLKSEFERNPEASWRDYGAMPPDSLENYFKMPQKIEGCVDTSIIMPEEEYIVPDIKAIKEPCFMAGDPALKNDAFGIAMCHKDSKSGKIIVDLAHNFKPDKKNDIEVDARKVTKFILDMIEKHNVIKFVSDTWSFPRALQEIREAGVEVQQNMVAKKHYDRFKELVYMEEIVLPNNHELLRELKSLELVNGKKVDHPNRGSKDIADAVVNSLFLCDEFDNAEYRPIAFVM